MTAYVPGWRYSRATGWLPDAEQTVPVGSTWQSRMRDAAPTSVVVRHDYDQRGHEVVTLERNGAPWSCSPVWLVDYYRRIS